MVEKASTLIEENRHWIAATASFLVPGLGQVYNGQFGKGLWIFLLSIFIIPYVFGVIDAYAYGLKEVKSLKAARAPRGLLMAAPIAPMNRKNESLEYQLLMAAKEKHGEISVSEGVMVTGASFKDVEETLDKMCHAGYVEIGNRGESGIIVYRFA